MKKRVLVIMLGFGIMAASAGCQFDKPFEGSGHSKDGSTYTITIETEDVWSIGVGNDNSSTGVENADNTAYQVGDQVVFEELDYEDGEEIIWMVYDKDGNEVDTVYNYKADGQNHDMIVNADRNVVEK